MDLNSKDYRIICKEMIGMKGILTDCITGNEKEIEIGYKIIDSENGEIFELIGGVTGYESFYIKSKYTPLNKICGFGWCACAGTKGKYDKLFIPAEEMRNALKPYIE
jgi:hypothetical protein